MSEQQPTHADWERERGRREQAAMQAVDAILAGDMIEATRHALAAHGFELSMRAIRKILDAQDDSRA
jgi:hypothetical protein